jgi:hypothetical protein
LLKNARLKLNKKQGQETVDMERKITPSFQITEDGNSHDNRLSLVSGHQTKLLKVDLITKQKERNQPFVITPCPDTFD